MAIKKEKKTTKSKTTTKVSVKKTPKKANPENYFMMVNGVPLKDLKELASTCETMNDWVFNHHVNDARNDFANWVGDVLKEEELASEIKKAWNPKDLEIVILRFFVNKYVQ